MSGINYSLELTHLLLSLWKGGNYTPKDLNGNSISVEKNVLMLTKFDLQSISPSITDKELLQYITTDIWFDITTENGLNQLNKSFIAAINLYGSLNLRKIFDRKWAAYSLIQHKQPFKNTGEVIAFIRKAGNESWENRLHCLIIKVTSAVHDYMNGPLAWLYEKDQRFCNHIFNSLWLTSELWRLKWYIAGENVIVHGEPKSQSSSVWKSLSNPKYHSSEKIMDGIRYTIEVNTEHPWAAIRVLENIYSTLTSFWKSIISIEKIDNKQMIRNGQTPHGLKDPDFIKEINKALEKSTTKIWTTDNYREIKILWKFEETGFEIKVVLKENQNQNWIAFQGIYAYITKYIGQQIRLASDGYVTDEDISSMAETFYNDMSRLIEINPEIRDIKTPEKLSEELWSEFQKLKYIRQWMNFRNWKWKIRETELIWWISEYFKSKLIPVKYKDFIVWTDKRWLELSKLSFYPIFERRIEKLLPIKNNRRVSDTKGNVFDATTPWTSVPPRRQDRWSVSDEVKKSLNEVLTNVDLPNLSL